MTGIPARGTIRIRIGDRDAVVTEAPAASGYIVGRSDPKSSYLPDIDLSTFDALDKGISRRHAALVRYQDHLHLVDLGSVNGTFINDERLRPDEPYLLNAGDHVRLGTLEILITQND